VVNQKETTSGLVKINR